MKELMENVLPYLDTEKVYTEKELEMEKTRKIIVPNLINLFLQDAQTI